MTIQLLSISPDALHHVVYAARLCKNSFNLSDTPSIRAQKPEDFAADKVGPKDIGLVRECLAAGHESITEHVSISFRFDLSRATQAQLTRHRLASFSAESSRAVSKLAEEASSIFFVPPKIADAGKEGGTPHMAATLYLEGLDHALHIYKTLITEYKIAVEDARYILPMALVQPIVMTANLREWRHILRERTCVAAQYEIRRAMKMIRVKIGAIHDIFTHQTSNYDTCPKAAGCGLCLTNWENIDPESTKVISND